MLHGLTTDEEKLAGLYAFCQSHVTNFDYFDNAVLQEAKKKLERKEWSQSPAQTLALGTGTPTLINELFASLAKAAGYEVRLVLCASRYATLNVKHRDGWVFMRDRLVAIKLGEAWHYYSPGDYYVPAGLLHYSNEAVPGLICDADKVLMENTTLAPAGKSPVKRTGRFTLDAEGTLEGQVDVSLDGHVGSGKKQHWAGTPQDEIDTEFRAEIVKRMPAAEITDLRWENLTGNTLPLIVHYRLKVPAYADVAGSKLIITPNVFEHGASATFKSETRKYGIFFRNAYKENDDIEIVYPEGFALDAGSSPQNIGDTATTLGTRYQLGVKPKSRRILYKREFVLGASGGIGFQAASYPLLKKMCDAILRSDEQTLVFKTVEPVPPPAATEPATPAPKE